MKNRARQRENRRVNKTGEVPLYGKNLYGNADPTPQAAVKNIIRKEKRT